MAETDVAAPAATEAPAAPATGQTQDPKPAGNTPAEVQKSARSQVHELGEKWAKDRQSAREAREKHHSQEQPRDEAGKFKETEAAPAAPVSDTTAGSATVVATTEPATEGPPAGLVRIELPEGHPLRDQGETYLDVPVAAERKWRTAVNAAARRADVEAAERMVQEERAARLRTEAELRFVREQGGKFWTPENQATYDDLARAYGQEAADAYRRGQQLKAEGAMAEVRESADLQAVEQHWHTEGEAFRSEALRYLPSQFPGLQPNEVQQALTMYALDAQAKQDQAWARVQGRMGRAEFERRFAQEFRYSEQDFMAVAGDYLKTRPGVIAQTQAARDAEALRERTIRAETEAAERERLKDAGRRHATNPQRALGGVSQSGSGTLTATEAPDRTKMSPDQIRKSLREDVRELGNAVGRAARR